MSLPGTLDIGEVSAQSGLPASALRFYEEKGLIQSVGRNGLRRTFDPGVVRQLSFISLGRQAGFSLDDLKEMLTADGQFRIDRDRLREKADILDRKIKQLTMMRDGLRHAADCRAPSHMECPTFQRLMRWATKTTLRKRKPSVALASRPSF